jgi:spoIIIJ-associated protein
MLEQKDIDKIKKSTEEFFEKMTITATIGEVGFSGQESGDSVSLDIRLQEPQILIGQGGQTLFEIQRLLKMVLNKKLQKIFYLDLDINEYKKKKIEYLKNLAKESADQVTFTKEEKSLLPMPSYERRIVHAELSQRTDIIAESQGDGLNRHIVIKAK